MKHETWTEEQATQAIKYLFLGGIVGRHWFFLGRRTRGMVYLAMFIAFIFGITLAGTQGEEAPTLAGFLLIPGLIVGPFLLISDFIGLVLFRSQAKKRRLTPDELRPQTQSMDQWEDSSSSITKEPVFMSRKRAQKVRAQHSGMPMGDNPLPLPHPLVDAGAQEVNSTSPQTGWGNVPHTKVEAATTTVPQANTTAFRTQTVRLLPRESFLGHVPQIPEFPQFSFIPQWPKHAIEAELQHNKQLALAADRKTMEEETKKVESVVSDVLPEASESIPTTPGDTVTPTPLDDAPEAAKSDSENPRPMTRRAMREAREREERARALAAASLSEDVLNASPPSPEKKEESTKEDVVEQPRMTRRQLREMRGW